MSRAYSSFSPNINQKNDKTYTFNFSLDVKSYMKKKAPQMSITNKFKKNQIHQLNLKSAYSTPINYGYKYKQHPSQSIRFKQHSSKNIKQKRRLSLIGNIKHNQSLKHQTSLIQDQIFNSKYQKIKQLLKDEKYIIATTQIKQLIPQVDDKKKRRELYFWLIASLTKSNKLQQAEQFVHKCLNQFPSFYQAILYLGQISFKLRKMHEAVRSYEKAILIQEQNSEAYIQLSDVYSSQGQHNKAYQVLLSGFQRCIYSITIPIKIIQNLIQRQKVQQSQCYLNRIVEIQNSKSSDYFYAKGIIQQNKQREVQSCIYYQQSIKLNTSRQSVAKSLQNYVNIQIRQRDFYSAYHNIKRCKHLKINLKKLEACEVFLEGAILIMKKMYRQGIQTLCQFLIKFKQLNNEMHQLIKKYLAYATFKIGNHSQAISYYKRLHPKSRDQVSNYNMLIAQGIQQADKKNQLEKAIQKFEQAKIQYSNKVEPYIYIAMVLIKKINLSGIKGQQKYQAVIKALEVLDEAQSINSCSSNLLYHRAIVFLFFQDYDQAHKDINRCIQKAEQNLPKYFYLRGLCYSCTKQLKKAVNQFSIAVSLDKQYSQAYLQRSKCYFLLGQSDRGFEDLKLYMELQPQDLSVHRWIGDLLYQGGSYQDALKAYNQMQHKIDIQALCMKIKCQLKLGLFKNCLQTFKNIQKHENYRQDVFVVDRNALQILHCLINGESQKNMSIKLSKLNNQLQLSSCGKIFVLVDCMVLIGIASFYLNRFKQAFQSFCLALQLHKSLVSSELVIKATDQQQCLSLKIQDIYLNILMTLIALGDRNQILKFIKEDLLPIWKDKSQIKLFTKLIKTSANQFLSNNKETLYIDSRIQNIYSKKMRKVQLSFKSIIIKTSMIFVPFHETIDTLYSNEKARSMIDSFHAGYIDNMPEAPWIKRNQYGVIFTDEIMPDQSNCTFLTTERKQQDEQGQQKDNQSVQPQTQNNKKAFLRQMKLDLQIEKKLSKIINKDKKGIRESQTNKPTF